MKKTNLKESLAKMRYLAGLMTEGQLKEFYEEDKYFKSDNKFSPQSSDSVSELYTLLKSEGAKLSIYPEWVLRCLSEDEYVEQVPNSDLWILNREGQSIFRNENKLQQYLIGVDEEDVSLDEFKNNKNEGIEGRPGNYSSDKKLDEDISPEQMINHYKSQLSSIKPGTGQHNPAFKIEARSNGQDTKWIDLNKDSATILVSWLTENFINKSDGSVNEFFSGIKDALHLSANYHDVKDIWNEINDMVHKMYPHLKNINGGTGFTNGGSTIKFVFSDFESSHKTVKINGQIIPFDKIKGFVKKEISGLVK